MFELKPCPFCGGEAVYFTNCISNNGFTGFDFSVKCKKCGINVPEIHRIRISLAENGELSITEDERWTVAEKWNRRTIDEQP